MSEKFILLTFLLGKWPTFQRTEKNQKPVARCDINQSHLVGQRNHAIKDSSLPKRTAALAEGIVGMLLKNKIVELGLKNRFIGSFKDMLYNDTAGPRGPEGFKMHPSYVIVHFPGCKIPEDGKIMPGWPRTYVPIVPYYVSAITNVAPPFRSGCVHARLLQNISHKGNSWVQMKYEKRFLLDLWLPCYVAIKRLAWNESPGFRMHCRS
jgi:hypothetical protein